MVGETDIWSPDHTDIGSAEWVDTDRTAGSVPAKREIFYSVGHFLS